MRDPVNSHGPAFQLRYSGMSLFRFPATFLTPSSYRKAILWRVEAGVRRLSHKFGKGAASFQSLILDPEDVNFLGQHADRTFRSIDGSLPFGSVERSREILKIIGDGFPTPLLEDAYFSNLDALLARETPLSAPGQLVLGLGTGRSGSTSLAARLGAMERSCSTHENPPLVFWRPRPEQVSFHLRRFGRLTRYYALVADCAHWWLNVVDELLREFPNVKFVGLVRDRFECTVSFARIKGLGRKSYNHWAPQPNNLWSPTQWDPTYPKFEIPGWANRDPDRAKWNMIENYIDQYNSRMEALAARLPDRFLILRTELLSEATAVAALFKFAGAESAPAVDLGKLNVRSTKDGHLGAFKF